ARAKSNFSMEDVYRLKSGETDDTVNLKIFTVEIDRSALINKQLFFNSEDKISILDQIQKKGEFYIRKSEIAQGIVPNPDRVNSRNIKTLGVRNAEERGVKIGDGVFVLDKAESKEIQGSDVE